MLRFFFFLISGCDFGLWECFVGFRLLLGNPKIQIQISQSKAPFIPAEFTLLSRLISMEK